MKDKSNIATWITAGCAVLLVAIAGAFYQQDQADRAEAARAAEEQRTLNEELAKAEKIADSLNADTRHDESVARQQESIQRMEQALRDTESE